jgi:hypothetical protein
MSRASTSQSPARSPASRAASLREPAGRKAWISRVALDPSSGSEVADAKRQAPHIEWDGNGRVFFTTLACPDLLVFLHQFGLGVPNQRTLLELDAAERHFCTHASGFRQASHYVRVLRSDAWGLSVPDALLNHPYRLYLRQLLQHLQDSQRLPPPPYSQNGSEQGGGEAEASSGG